MENLKRLSDAASPGPWSYRPLPYDDWGDIRSAEGKSQDGFLWPIVAKSRPLWKDYGYAEHRRNGTDPMEPNGRFIVELVNAYREGRLVEKSK